MSIDIFIAPRFGWVGQFLYRRFDWPRTGEGTNLATNTAFANLTANVERQASRSKHAAVLSLFKDGHVSGRRFRLFPAEWQALELHFTNTPVSEIVCAVLEGDPFEGQIVNRHDEVLIVTFSPKEVDSFVRENDRFAAQCGIKGFQTRSLRDAFFTQFNELASFLPTAIRAGRGLLLQ